MDKVEILAALKQLAATDDGKAPGRERFERETGIRMAEWYPHLWLRWSDAVTEAGLKPNKLQVAISDDVVIQRYVEFVRQLGQPTYYGGVKAAIST